MVSFWPFVSRMNDYLKMAGCNHWGHENEAYFIRRQEDEYRQAYHYQSYFLVCWPTSLRLYLVIFSQVSINSFLYSDRDPENRYSSAWLPQPARCNEHPLKMSPACSLDQVSQRRFLLAKNWVYLSPLKWWGLKCNSWVFARRPSKSHSENDSWGKWFI